MKETLTTSSEAPHTPNGELVEVNQYAPSSALHETAIQLFEESDVEKRQQLKLEAAHLVSSELTSLDPTEVNDALSQINEQYRGVFDGLDLCLLSASSEQIVMVDTHGELIALEVTEENAKQVLEAVKVADAEKRNGHSYALRREIMKRSNGKIPSFEAYTYESDLPNGAELEDHLDNPESWVPERNEMQQEIISAELQMAHELSERLDDETPTVYAMRGNTAAGKTTAIRSSKDFAKALDETGEPSGSINPDTYKTTLKSNDAEGEIQVASHYQTHDEGSMIARQIAKRLAESDSSMVIDKRLSKESNITELIELATERGKEVKILDVDVPLELSLVRVLGRKVGGDSPNVPFFAVAEGFSEIRRNRASLLKRVAEDEKIVNYTLKAADETGKSVEVASKVDGQMFINQEHEALLRQSVDGESTSAEIERLAETVITDEYIKSYIDKVHGDDPEGSRAEQTRQSLVRYKNKTLKQALDERASTLNEGEMI